MSVNSMNFEQSAAFLTALYQEATGQQGTLQVANTADFTSVATTLLQMGYDPIISALSQVLNKTIFSIRPYNAKFTSIEVDSQRWGAITRKINFLDTALDSADERLSLVDGSSVDHYVVKKPKALQTNFYGATQYQDHITIFKDQLDSAFEDAGQFGRFLSGVMQNLTDKLEQVRESEARGVLINFITSIADVGGMQYINVLQAYKDETGVSLTPADMFSDTNYAPFTRWLAGFMLTLQDMMAQRSLNYHFNITGSEVMRHTPVNRMKKFISANVANFFDTVATANIYNPDRLNGFLSDAEKISYWQNIDNPYSVQATPTYLDTSNGQLITQSTPVLVENLIGVLADEEACGITRMSTWTASTPLNAAGGYTNMYFHHTQKTWNDFTENFVVLYADTPT